MGLLATQSAGLMAANMPSQEPVDFRTLTDEELAKFSIHFTVQAFEQLYLRHHRRVFSICLRMVGNPAGAEDLTQDVFIRVYRKLNSFRGDSKFTTWLHRITVNEVLMYFRRQNNKTGQTKLVYVDQNNFPEPNVPSLPEDLQMDLKKAINSLPPGYRNVLIYHDIYGLDHSEVGNILGISDGTSKSQLHKARLKMRRLLDKQSRLSFVRP